MTENLDSAKVKWLTYLIYFLLAVLTFMSGWNTTKISAMPDKYVRLERYQSDSGRIECTLRDIDSKLDRIIERGLPKGGGDG
ncbi:MAG: hypothetical protein GY846_26405 [Deltaproteobacteria bacterium]|nr:hypothetical protein [Deltaproteobacteria bacterium]